MLEANGKVEGGEEGGRSQMIIMVSRECMNHGGAIRVKRTKRGETNAEPAKEKKLLSNKKIMFLEILCSAAMFPVPNALPP